MNTCMDIRDRLNDYVDGDVSAEGSAVIDAHLGECADCRAELDALRSLQTAARELPAEVMPARELWPGIAERIDAATATRNGGNIVPFRSAWVQVLTAAAVIALIAGGLFSIVPVQVHAPATQPGPVSVNMLGDRIVSESFAEVEAEYRAAKAELQEALDAARDELPPETAEAVTASLASIDAAATDIRLALADQPGNPRLERLLIAVYQQELNALEQVVRLAPAG
ncbi:MAG: zf-HC2 domain-containing protein [Candidatus Hydrogenedentales bacterium]